MGQMTEGSIDKIAKLAEKNEKIENLISIKMGVQNPEVGFCTQPRI